MLNNSWLKNDFRFSIIGLDACLPVAGHNIHWFGLFRLPGRIGMLLWKWGGIASPLSKREGGRGLYRFFSRARKWAVLNVD